MKREELTSSHRVIVTASLFAALLAGCGKSTNTAGPAASASATSLPATSPSVPPSQTTAAAAASSAPPAPSASSAARNAGDAGAKNAERLDQCTKLIEKVNDASSKMLSGAVGDPGDLPKLARELD